MKIINETNFGLAPIAGRINFPGHTLTVIVKGAFHLPLDGTAKALDKVALPKDTTYHPEDEDQTGSPYYDSDFAYFKPQADILLAGKCYPPDGKPVNQCRVKLKVGELTKSLQVIGNRTYTPGILKARITPAEPFESMDLRFENAFGGVGFPDNPVGKGYTRSQTEKGKTVYHLPNIEDPDHPITNSSSSNSPVGLGPILPQWPQRKTKLGTYKGNYLKTRWPWFAEDFDWAHFNAALPDMQVKDFLKGDEAIEFENLHPAYSTYRSTLPGLGLYCYACQVADPMAHEAPPADEKLFRPLGMNLDTLFLEPHKTEATLVWRGQTNIVDEDFAELTHIYVFTQPLTSPVPSREHAWQKLRSNLAGEKPAPAVVPPPVEEVEPDKPADEDTEEDPKINAAMGMLAEATEKLKISLAAIGLNYGTKEQFEASIAAEEAKLKEATGLDFKTGERIEKPELDPDEAEKNIEQSLAEFETASSDLKANLAAQAMAAGVADQFNATWKAEEDKIKAKLGFDKLEDEGKPEIPVSAREKRAKLLARIEKGETIAGEIISGVDLSAAILTGANFSTSIFNEATLLAGADLGAANLSGCTFQDIDLRGAKLAGANLMAADLTGCNLEGVDLTDAELSGAILEKANLKDAKLTGAVAKKVIFIEADLTRANLNKCQLEGADLSFSRLDKASLRQAKLVAATLEGAVGAEVDMTKADLSKVKAAESPDFHDGCFREIKAPGSIWQGANLAGADFTYTKMARANFTRANLVGANLYAADLSKSTFRRADLTRARLVEMNLFEASMERACLVSSDWTGANMYGVEFLNADTTDAVRAGANLKNTKLERG